MTPFILENIEEYNLVQEKSIGGQKGGRGEGRNDNQKTKTQLLEPNYHCIKYFPSSFQKRSSRKKALSPSSRNT